MFGLGTKKLIIIVVVLILLFGAKKIPELAKSVTEAVKHLKGIFSDTESDDSSSQGKKK